MAAPAPKSSTRAGSPAASNSIEPEPAVAAAPGHDLAQIAPAAANFRPTTVTSTLAIALLLAGAILRLTRRPQRFSRRDPRDVAADWLDACSGMRTAFADMGGMAGRGFAETDAGARRRFAEVAEAAGRHLAAMTEAAGRSLSDAAATAGKACRGMQTALRRNDPRPRAFVRTHPPADPTPDLKASLGQLMRDMRRAEAAAEPPRAFAPDSRRQLRALLARAASMHSQTQSFDGDESTQLAEESGLATDLSPDASDSGSHWRQLASHAPAW